MSVMALLPPQALSSRAKLSHMYRLPLPETAMGVPGETGTVDAVPTTPLESASAYVSAAPQGMKPFTVTSEMLPGPPMSIMRS
jgi:hypothetical protein